jgi:hypothetical protein
MKEYISDLLLLHQFSIGAVIYHVRAENRRRQGGVDLFSVDVLELRIENELVALDSKANCRFPAQEYEGKDIAVLFHAVSNFIEKGRRALAFSRHLKKNLYGSMP